MKNLFLAVLSGLILASGWPTYGFPLLLFFGFVPLLWVSRDIRLSEVKRKSPKIFALSYLTFFIFNIITTYWLYYSTGFGMWFAVLVNSLLMAFIWHLYYRVSRQLSENLSLIFLIAIWMLFEWLHLHWEFAWPWLNLGNGFASFTGWIQWYEYTGTFGGSLWILAGNVLLYKSILTFKKTANTVLLAKRSLYLILYFFVPFTISQLILAGYEEKSDPVEVVLLQPNIDPYTEKYNTTNERIADLLFEDARKALKPNTDFLIAPETVLAQGYGVDLRNFEFAKEKEKAQEFLLDYPDLNYLTGIQFYRFYNNENEIIPTSNLLGTDRMGNPVWGDFFNSAIMLNASDTTQIYHKSKLVVGVENFPYQNVLKPLLGNIMIDLGGTVSMKTRQDKRGIFTGDDGTKVAPVICYESVFGEFVTGYVKEDAQFLAIITNDAWWGESQGHKQHLDYARLRAIENRRSVARSANTGISAIINQKGEIEKNLKYGVRGTVTGTLNKNDQLTFYTKYGDYLPKIAILPAILILGFSIYSSQKNKG